jgi:hypothetical protein
VTLTTSLAETNPGEPVGSWMPTRYTPSLTGTEDFRTEGDKAIAFAELHTRLPELGNRPVKFYDWQRWLARHVLERYPDDWPVVRLRGQLRFRQVVISMGRQNGKSLLAVLFILYFLVKHVRGPRVIGLASRDRQAKIVYNRVKFAIDNDPTLSSEIRTTNTRGISRRDGTGEYQTLPADEDAAQGEPATGVLYDELHLGLAALWDAMLLAMRAKRNAMMIGITTQGDDSSQLLIRLMAEGEAAIAGHDERFGFFCWEAPSDDLTVEGVIAANPTIACGAIPLETAWSDAVKMYADLRRGPDGLTGRQRVIRYTLNRAIAGAADAWVSSAAWSAGGSPDLELHDAGPLVFAVQRTETWEALAITATTRDGEDYRTCLAASILDPDPADLEAALVNLAHRYGHRAVFALPAKRLGKVANNLKRNGFEVWRLGEDEEQAAAQTAAGLIKRQVVHHPDDALVRIQNARARRRKVGDGWRLSESLSNGDIDAVAATTFGLYVAATREQSDGINLW